MTAIVITRRGGVLEYEGDPTYQRCVDPYRDDMGRPSYSLESGWKWTDGELDVFADRLGMVPIFCRRKPDRVILSNSLTELCALDAPSRIDHAALAVFLRLGYFLGDTTPIEGVEVLSPGLRHRLTVASLDIPRARTSLAPQPGSLDHEATVQRYIDLFHRAVARRAHAQRIALPLSGGRDSRHILFELLRLERGPAFAVTYRERGSNDEMAAKELCSSLNVPHVITQVPNLGYFDLEDRKNRQTHFLTDEHYWFSSVVAILKEQGAELFFDGIGGDVLSNGLFFDASLAALLRKRDLGAAAERLLGPRHALPFLSRDWQRTTSWEIARDALVAELGRHGEHVNPIKSFYFWNRTRREISLAPIAIADGVPVAMPYLDHDLIDFFMALPDDYAAPGFHDLVIRRAFPQFADFPYASKGSQVREPLSHGERARAAWLALRLARRSPVSGGFVLPRAVVTLASTHASSTLWWLGRLVYLDGLLAATGVTDG